MLYRNGQEVTLPGVEAAYMGTVCVYSSGVDASVSGVSPLTLPNALARPMQSLVQYGKCAQSATPAPDAPADIVCNNGTLQIVDDELPSGYRRVLDITFDGTAYYRTGVKLYGSDVVTMTLSNTSSSGQNVFGSYSGTAAGNKNFSFYVYGGNSASNSYLRYNESLYRPRFGSGERTISFGAGGSNGFTTDVDFGEETFESSATAYIGHLPNSSSSKYSGTINGAITVGSRLKYVPCERISDNVVGYYEVNTGVFLEPVAGHPTFSGYDPSHLTLKGVGTPEVLTVGGQTASAVDLFAVEGYADTQDIISGAVERKCEVFVIDGTEEWLTNSSYTGMYYADILPNNAAYTRTSVWTHWEGVVGSTTLSSMGDKKAKCGSSSNRTRIHIRDTSFATVDDFKVFLSAQYAQGTPVIVLYPLATPKTEVAGAQPLFLSAGVNVLEVNANVSGIQLEATYKARQT